MIYNQILVRFGDLTLKGKNQKVFLKALYKLMDEKMKGLNVYVEHTHDRIFIHLNDEDVNIVSKNDIKKILEKILIINDNINRAKKNLNKNLCIDRFLIDMWRCK